MITTTLSLLLALTPVTLTDIPKNFLLTEPAARKVMDPDEAYEHGYKISDKRTKPLELNPCNHRSAADRGRVAARTITYWSSAPSGSSEQLIVYKNVKAAHAAFAGLRAEAKRCARKGDPASPQLEIRWRTSKVKVGDESLGLGYETYQDGDLNQSITGIVARRGSALLTYTTTEGDYAPGGLTKNAKKMATKVCELPGVC